MITRPRVLFVLWYGLAAFAVLAYLRHLLVPVIDAMQATRTLLGILDVAQSVAGLILVIGAFVLVHLLARGAVDGSARGEGGGQPTPQEQFPSRITLQVGAWLLASTAGFLIALIAVLRLMPPGQPRELLLTTLAAGIGSSIATILGYLKHASELKDFDPAFSAWYVGRPVIGLLLGLIFYFVIKAGFLATFPGAPETGSQEVGFVAIGGLIGLFSKNAVEKLRDVFNVLFQTREQELVNFTESLPKELRDEIKPHLPLEVRNSLQARETRGTPTTTSDTQTAK